jgi:hypothetical protein
MLKATRLVIAATIALSAVSAMASNFRAADQVYVPAAGRTGGASGTFITDVFVANVSDQSVDVSVVYIPLGTTTSRQTPAAPFRLAPGERREFVDFFDSYLHITSGFGQLIFNGCLAGADCTANAQDETGFSANFRDISVETRIYLIPPGTTLAVRPATTGQLFSGIPWYSFVSSLQATNGLDKIFITGIRATGNANDPLETRAGTYRSNIGLINASEFSNTTLAVQLWQGNVRVGNEFTVNLGPLGNTQILVGREIGAGLVGLTTGTNLWATVEQRNSTPRTDIQVPSTCLPDGCPAFLAYGSVLDNVSGDATTLEAQYMKALSRQAIEATYPTGAGKPTIRRSARR